MPLPDTSVKYFDSTMIGAPVLSGLPGSAINVLDACLVNGFGSVTLNSLVINNNVATGTVAAGHNFAMIAGINNVTPAIGPVIQIAGAAQSEVNGDWRLSSVPTSTTFTFVTEGIANQTASGTITAKRAPAGWAKLFAGANKAVYRSLRADSTGMALRIDDSPNYSAAVVGYATMADIDTGTYPFPSTSNYGFVRSNATTSAARSWVLIADAHIFYHHIEFNGSAMYYTMQGFGDFLRASTADAYACILIRGLQGSGGSAASAGGVNSGIFLQNSSGLITPRSYNASTIAQTVVLYSTFVITWGSSVLPFPDPLSGGLVVAPIHVFESGVPRGVMPGIYAPLNNFPSQSHHKRVERGYINGLDRALMLLGGQTGSYAIATDITGPWR